MKLYTSSNRNIRRQLFVARKAQGRLLFRVFVYCVVTALLTMLNCLGLVFLGATTGFIVLAVLVTLALVTSVALYDAANVSNRLVGPIVRAHGLVRGLANDDVVQPLEVRDGDEWQEWIQDFNSLVARLNVSSRRGVSVEGVTES